MTIKKIKKQKVVIVDYDDTIGDFLGTLCRIHNRSFGTCVTSFDITEWDFTSMEVKDVRGNIVNGSELRETFVKYENEIYASMDLYSDSLFALETIRAIGYRIIILTARPEAFRHQTIYNLLFRGVPFDDIIFNWDKVKEIKRLSKEYNVQLFVDDNAKTIASVWENCKVQNVCIIEKKHNVEIELDDEIIRVGSIMDCLKYLKEVIKK